MQCVKKPLLGLILAGFAGTVAAVPVVVGPSDLGTLTTPVLIGNSFGSKGLFSDVYTFTLGSISSTVGTAFSFKFNLPLYPGPEYKIKNFELALFDETGTIEYDSGKKTVEAILAPGDYQFVVSGKVAGNWGGAYGGVLAATPIPEAKNVTMILAGLGLVGFAVARRRTL